MALFPRIQSPCPYRDNLDEIIDGSHCRSCQREVHDITGLSDAERVALVAGCKDEICVSYKISARTALAAATLGAALGMPMAAAAQEAPAQDGSAQAAEDPMPADDYIIVGGLKEPKRTVWVKTHKPANLAALPVVYDDVQPGTKPAQAPQAPARPKPVNPAS